MAEITRIYTQKNDKARCNIEIDGKFFCGMRLETVVSNRLRVGTIVSEGELVRMQLESEKSFALDKALRHISISPKTEKEIRDFLIKKGFLSDVCNYVIEKMKNYGYLDDTAYAAAYIESAGKKKGSRLLAAELRRKGVPDPAIEDALQAMTGEKESAKALFEKYMRGKSIDKRNLQRAYTYLVGKGFSYETAHDVIASSGIEDDN